MLLDFLRRKGIHANVEVSRKFTLIFFSLVLLRRASLVNVMIVETFNLQVMWEMQLGEQRWCSGENARLPPMWPRFDSQTRRYMWVEFVVGSLLCSKRFFSGYSGFPLSLITNISKFQFDPGMHGHFWTSSCELLGAPWVNKLHFFYKTLHMKQS